MSTPVTKSIDTERQLVEVLTSPRTVLVEFVRGLSSPLVVLGAGGKMGPTLCVLAHRAARQANHPLDVVAVSRFSDANVRAWLEDCGVRTLSCDIMDRTALVRLPDTENAIYLVGLKFGTTADPALTWAINALGPSYVSERYPTARVAALSTGNVYRLVPVDGSGSNEDDPLTPTGEYANSCVARERIFQFSSRQNRTPIALVRLSYALDLRYGVLVDIARKVAQEEPVDVTMGYANAIWQGDANEMVIRSLGLASVPPLALNLTGSRFSLRDVALRLGNLMERQVKIVGTEADTAFLSNTTRMRTALGAPPTSLDTVLQWTASWVARDGRIWEKPTHFEVRDGAY
jgi:nucleoside-diphosphate-sugar epimerase